MIPPPSELSIISAYFQKYFLERGRFFQSPQSRRRSPLANTNRATARPVPLAVGVCHPREYSFARGPASPHQVSFFDLLGAPYWSPGSRSARCGSVGMQRARGCGKVPTGHICFFAPRPLAHQGAPFML